MIVQTETGWRREPSTLEIAVRSHIPSGTAVEYMLDGNSLGTLLFPCGEFESFFAAHFPAKAGAVADYCKITWNLTKWEEAAEAYNFTRPEGSPKAIVPRDWLST